MEIDESIHLFENYNCTESLNERIEDNTCMIEDKSTSNIVLFQFLQQDVWALESHLQNHLLKKVYFIDYCFFSIKSLYV